MLRELLVLLSEGNTLTQYSLAERLRTTPEAIAAGLDYLHRAGYLRKVCAAKDCGKKCAGCPLTGTLQNSAIFWEAVK
jgi:predicted ArsR family transcriptional regulator